MKGEIGPFHPLVEIEVPLWLGVELKKKQKCQIHPPSWLNKEYLEEYDKKETESSTIVDSLPFHFIEISQILLEEYLSCSICQ